MEDIEILLEKIRAERKARRSFPLKDENIIRGYDCSTGYGKSTDEVGHLAYKLIELKKNEPSSDDIFRRLTIIGYEFGYVQRALAYAEIFKDSKEKKIHLANAKLEIADLITQIHLLCITLGYDIEELRKLGVQHLEERQQEFKRYGWRK